MKMNRFCLKIDYRIIIVLIPFMIILGFSRHPKTVVDAPRKVFTFEPMLLQGLRVQSRFLDSRYRQYSLENHKVISSKRLYAIYRNIVR